jgi:hypothetical protein
MSLYSSRARRSYDALLAFQPIGSDPQTGSGEATNRVSVDILSAVWSENQVAEVSHYTVQIGVTALANTGTYAVDIDVASDIDFTSPTTIASASITQTGQFGLGVDRGDLQTALGGSATGYLRLNMTLGGTSPSITYVAYCAPVSR